MNETQRFFENQLIQIDSVIDGVKNLLSADEHIVFHQTVVSEAIITRYHELNSDSHLLGFSRVYRITKDLPNSRVLYLGVMYKRYGRTYKPKKYSLLDWNFNTIIDCAFDATWDTILADLTTAIRNNF
jgi:hypothetical protein